MTLYFAICSHLPGVNSRAELLTLAWAYARITWRISKIYDTWRIRKIYWVYKSIRVESRGVWFFPRTIIRRVIRPTKKDPPISFRAESLAEYASFLLVRMNKTKLTFRLIATSGKYVFQEYGHWIVLWEIIIFHWYVIAISVSRKIKIASVNKSLPSSRSADVASIQTKETWHLVFYLFKCLRVQEKDIPHYFLKFYSILFSQI